MYCKKYIIVIVLLIGCWNITAQDSTAVQVIARSLEDRVLLRWAVNEPLAWKQANQVGFTVERITLSRNGQTLPTREAVLLTPTPLFPAALVDWEPIATADQNAAVIAQALYGARFEVGNMGGMESIMAVNSELEQRFTFALLAAEQNFKAAVFAGWGFEDRTVVDGEKYAYRVRVADAILADQIAQGVALAGLDLYEPLPPPFDFVASFSEGLASLRWNFNLLRDTYTNYTVERSRDSLVFEKVNASPIFNVRDAKDGEQINLTVEDSIPNNTTMYYRVFGTTSFGEKGPYSSIVSGKGLAKLKYSAHISRKQIIDENNVKIYWEYPEEGMELLKGFELRRSDNDRGPFKTVVSGIGTQAREVSYDKLKRINYFTVVALGKNGSENSSFAAIVQPVDSIPPVAPLGLTGTIDTTGVVHLKWKANLEKDLEGYRVFWANREEAEFSQKTSDVILKEQFIDTLPTGNSSPFIYYKIVAEDQRYNRSGFSAVLAIKKPDRTPPSPPVWTTYEVRAEGVFLKYTPSSSEDVLEHQLYRKEKGATENDWELVATQSPEDTAEFLDSEVASFTIYNYTVLAKDKTGLESLPAAPISIKTVAQKIGQDDIRLSATANRELRFIVVTWRVKAEEVVEYRLYRGTNGGKLKLFKTMKGTQTRLEDNELEINTNYTYGLQALLKQGVLSEIKKVEVKY